MLLEAPDVRVLQRRLRVLGRRAPGAAADVPPVRGAVDFKCGLAGHEVVARTAWRQVSLPTAAHYVLSSSSKRQRDQGAFCAKAGR